MRSAECRMRNVECGMRGIGKFQNYGKKSLRKMLDGDLEI